MEDNRITLYALSTCSHCKSTKKLLSDCDVTFDVIEVDKIDKEERQDVIEEVKKLNPRCSFPTLKIDDTVIVGYREEQIKEALGVQNES